MKTIKITIKTLHTAPSKMQIVGLISQYCSPHYDTLALSLINSTVSKSYELYAVLINGLPCIMYRVIKIKDIYKFQLVSKEQTNRRAGK